MADGKDKGNIGLGSIGAISAGIGVLLKTMLPMLSVVANVTPYSAAFIGMGAICGAIYVKGLSKFDRLWSGLNLRQKPRYVGKDDVGGHTVYEFKLPPGQSASFYGTLQEAIETFLGRHVEIDGDLERGRMSITALIEKPVPPWKPIQTDNPMEIIIGYDTYGRLVVVDLGRGTEPHIYICGTAGCGKSNTLVGIVANLLLFNDVELWLGDLKNGVELGMFQYHPKVLSLATDIEQMRKMIDEIFAEVDRRYKLLADNGVRSIQKYHQRVGHDLKYRAFVVDEFAEIMYGKENKETKEKLERISSKARACGIHLILATQRPDSEVISGRIKANIANAFGMATTTRVNSEVILDHGGCELLEVGQGILRRGIRETLVHVPLVDHDKLETLIQRSISTNTKTKG